MTLTLNLLDEGKTARSFMVEKSKVQEEAFFIANLDVVAQRYNEWTTALPDIKPYYAVKCNDSLGVLRLLASLGANFDCASKGEISKVLSLGVSADRIIFANPVKQQSHIKFAAKVGVNLTVFDSVNELVKLKSLHPDCKLVLRVKYDANDAQIPMGVKFGAEESDALDLIRTALALGMDVVGVSFHVGSGCRDPEAFPNALRGVAGIFQACSDLLGVNLSLVDIGGGFMSESFSEISSSVQAGLHETFLTMNEDKRPKIIAEPGRFLAADAFELAVRIHSVRRDRSTRMYYVNDGVYGSFTCMIYDKAVPTPIPLRRTAPGRVPTTIWGPTCDSLDVLFSNISFPVLELNDWICFPSMGAYSISSSSCFNGLNPPEIHYVASMDISTKVTDVGF